ncbi:hypothetical protein BGZ63DRAFT_405678 [Mariannaea sp. PMI_226]|nr:hypothetical protein BGZ63DRAFT_405678 [Mariannaea sp. PMI_226]
MMHQHLSSGILLIAGFLSSSVAGQVTCVENEDGSNLLSNPSFENGDPNDAWTIWTGFSGISTDEHTDGQQSLYTGGSESIVVFQSVDLEKDATYKVSFDYKPFYPLTSPQPSHPQTCDIWMEFDDPYPTWVGGTQYVYSAGDVSSWQTLSGSFVAPATSGSLAVVFSCQAASNDPNFFNDFKVFIDNGIAMHVTETCTTATSTTSEATTTTAAATTTTTSAEATTTTLPGKCGPKKQIVL